MTIDITSFFFNSSIEGATATAAWGTSIGQNQSKACRIEDEKPGVVDLLTGMLYRSISDLSRIDISAGSSKREVLLCALFDKVFVNKKLIDGISFTILLVRENTESHAGRLLISYPPYARVDGKATNSDAIKAMAEQLGCTEKGCWFVHDISVKNQDELHFSAVVVDPSKPKIYHGKSKDRSKEWARLVDDKNEASLEDLARILNDMYIHAVPLKQIAMVYAFVFTYGNYLVYNYKPAEVLKASGIKSTTLPDLEKAYEIYRKVAKGGISLYNTGRLSLLDVASPAAQKIYYGCPGTGKSFTVRRIAEGENDEKIIWYEKATETDKSCKKIDWVPSDEEKKNLTNNIFRTTFHPDYDYATFVGCYKPVKVADKLDYTFVPQVFTNAYVCALRHPEDPVYLIIEEINRGNCAQIFGDLFQLLDRTNGVSDYAIRPDTELSKHLASEGVPSESLRLPANLHIYATMNTSDQSLFPMDSAFKRRWAMEYMPIDYTCKKASKFTIEYGADDSKETYPWLGFLKMVNEKILNATDSEDKQMGEFFIKSSIAEKEFINKVMFYIWNDVCKDFYNHRRVDPRFFMKVKNILPTEKHDYFTFAELFSERNADSRLIREFILYLESEYIKDHTDTPTNPVTGHIIWDSDKSGTGTDTTSAEKLSDTQEREE